MIILHCQTNTNTNFHTNEKSLFAIPIICIRRSEKNYNFDGGNVNHMQTNYFDL